jgi:TRAP-type C4-dicarboxylate transport system permease small subunit
MHPSSIERVFDKLVTALGWMVAAVVLFFVVSITTNWALRFLGRSPISWVRDMVEYLLFAGVLLGSPWVLRQNAHVRVDLVLTSLPVRGRWLLELVIDLTGFLICGALAVFSGALAAQLFQEHSFVRKTITVDTWIFQAVIFVSMVLCMIEFVFRMTRPTAPDSGRQGH